MAKLLFIITSMLIILFGPGNTSEEKVTVNQDYPTAAQAGGDFKVNVHFSMGEVKGHAILQLNLPPGFTAENIDSRNGDFVYENNVIKYIWVDLPPVNEFTVSYKVNVAGDLRGSQVIKGTFLYALQGKTEEYKLPDAAIDISDQPVAVNPAPKIERKLICTNKNLGEYTVELNILPNGNNEHAQFTDEIPENFTALVIESHQADFTFVNNNLIFNWDKLPSVTSFKISYMVRSGKPGPSPVINGTMTYGNANFERKEIASQIETPPSEINSNAAPIENENQGSTAVNQDKKNNSSTSAATSSSQYQVKPDAANVVYYKIQISATQRSSIKDSHWFTLNYHIDPPVELTYHEGWKKYLVGSFLGYDEATKFREITKEKVSDAFIVAYQNGNRIPVKNAMRSTAMIR